MTRGNTLPPRTRYFLVALGLAVAATRFVAVSRSLWDWDEALFSMALQDFDVTQHHPHPPGFPLYVGLSKLARFVARTDFDALQAVNVAASLLVFPALFFLARALRFGVGTSALGALLFSFLPNVWFYGGTGFSDVPAIVVVIAAAALLFRGAEDRRAYFLGCVLLGASIAFRPQNALMGVWPWLVASWPRVRAKKFLEPLAGALVVIAVVAASYGGAAWATGSLTRFVDAVRSHGKYVSTIDSYRNPGRPPVTELFREFALDPFHVGFRTSLIFAGLALLAIARGRKPTFHALATFGPFFVFALFMLDASGVSRLSIGYMPLLALLLAEGVTVLATLVSFRRQRVLAILQVVFAAAILAKLVPWTGRALTEARRTDSPSYAACAWVRKHLDPATTMLYVHGSMGPFVDYYLWDYRRAWVDDDFAVDKVADTKNAWLITEGAATSSGSTNFRRARTQIWQIARKRYFDVSVRPLVGEVAFVDGWYDEESTGSELWRWMGSSATAALPSVGGNGGLFLRFYVPLDGLQKPPTVTLTMNGAVVDRFVCTTSVVERRLLVPSRPSGMNELRISTDAVVNPKRAGLSDDDRDLGLQLRAISWNEAR